MEQAQIEKIFARDAIHFEDYRTHLDELHHFIRTTLAEDRAYFTLEMLPGGDYAINKHNDGYLNINLEEIRYMGKVLPVALSNYVQQIIITSDLLPEEDVRIDQFEVVYTSLYDGNSHVKPVVYRELAYSFYVAGHIYGSHDKKGTSGQDDIHLAFAAALPEIAADESIEFGILNGDTVMIPSEISYANLKSAMEITGKSYYIAPGNHDLDGSGLFATHFGDTYRSFNKGNDLFLILTPELDWHLEDKQMQFLKKKIMENPNAANIFVFTHYLFWLDGDHFAWVQPNGGPYKKNCSNFWSEVTPLFNDYEGDVYFIAGDVGAFKNHESVVYERESNLHFIASGMGSGLLDNYLIAHVYDDGKVDFTVMRLDSESSSELGAIQNW